jgi:hypothetical protein
LEVARYRADKAKAMRGIKGEPLKESLAIMADDELAKGELEDIGKELGSAQDLPWQKDLFNATKGFFNPIPGSSFLPDFKADDKKMQGVKARAQALAEALAQRHEVSIEDALAYVQARLKARINENQTATSQQARDILRTPTRDPMLRMPGGGPAF